MSATETENLGLDINPNEVMKTVGEPQEDQAKSDSKPNDGKPSHSGDESLAVQKRLTAEKRKHAREIAALQEQLAMTQFELQKVSSPQGSAPVDPAVEAQDSTIQKAVTYALQQREVQEKQKLTDMSNAHVANLRSKFGKYLDDFSTKYDDFDDVVRGENVPISQAMADYALTLPEQGAGSAGEVLYHLGKNPEELARISKLHPINQRMEMAKLSHALVAGLGKKAAASAKPSPLGTARNMPAPNPTIVNENTPVEDIINLMRAGKFNQR